MSQGFVGKAVKLASTPFIVGIAVAAIPALAIGKFFSTLRDTDKQRAAGEAAAENRNAYNSEVRSAQRAPETPVLHRTFPTNY